jgi:Zn-dependent protease with chaperone function
MQRSDEPFAASGCDGRYSDGRSAASQRVAVRFGAAGLEIAAPDGQPVRTWPYTGLSPAQPIRSGTADVLLRSAAEPGATLFVASVPFVAELARRAPQLTARAERWRYVKPGLAVVGLIGAIVLASYLAGWSPLRSIAGLVPQKTWRAAGGHLAANFEKDYPGCTEAAGKAALAKLVARLTEATGRETDFSVHVANWGLVNAFAMPGQHLMLTRGLIRDAASVEEVAGVLAHEMGHGLERHPEVGIVRQFGLTVAVKLVFAGGSDLLQTAGTGLLLLRSTREAEREADRSAFAMLKQARISPEPLANFFERMAKKEGSGTYSKVARQYEIFSTHPALEERARIARAQPRYPTEPILTEPEWQALRGLCRAAPGSSGPGEPNILKDGPGERGPK